MEVEVEAVQTLEDGSYKAVIDGQIMFVPDDMSNRHRSDIQKWMEAGNIPDPAPPPEPTVAEEMEQRRASDVVVDEILKRLSAVERR